MLRDIVERDTAPPKAPSAPSLPSDPSSSSSGGFPAIVHRSQRTSKRPSAFANRNAPSGLHIGRGVDSVPVVQAESSSTTADVTPSSASQRGKDLTQLSEAERVQKEVDAENAARVEGMSAEEREQEVEELKERFGAGLVDIMRKRREKRLAAEDATATEGAVSPSGPSDSAAQVIDVPMTETQPVDKQVGEESGQKVEAMSKEESEEEAEVVDERTDGEVIELLKKRDAIRAAKVLEANAEIKAQNGSAATAEVTAPRLSDKPESTEKAVRFDEIAKRGSVTDIPSSSSATPLARYFPNQQPETAKLAWTQDATTRSSTSAMGKTGSAASPDSLLRFDFFATLLSAAQQDEIPVSHGLHHHGKQPDKAGYTLDEMMLLSRSTMPMQQIGMLRLLSRIMEVYMYELVDGDGGSHAEDGSRQPDLAKDRTAVLAELARLNVPRKMLAVAKEVIMSQRGTGFRGAAISLLYASLGGPSWDWLDASSSLTTQTFQPRAAPIGPVELPDLAEVRFEVLMPALVDMLGGETYLEPVSTEQLYLILRRATIYSPELAQRFVKLGPYVLRAQTTSRTWPHRGPARKPLGRFVPWAKRSPREMPLSSPIAFVRDLVSASRQSAVELHNARIADGLLKFLITTTWSSTAAISDVNESAQADKVNTLLSWRAASAELATETLKLLAVLGRYGLGAALATGALDLWRDLYNDIDRIMTGKAVTNEGDDVIFAPLIVAYFDLIAVWTTCAIDPHRTTPEHDLTWSQMDNFGWADQAISVITLSTRRLKNSGGLAEGTAASGAERIGEETAQLYIISSALGALVAWLDGVKVNGIKQGQAGKEAVLGKLVEAGLSDVFERAQKGEMAIHQAVLLRLVQVHARLSLNTETTSEQANKQILSMEQITGLSLRYTSPIPKGPLAQTYTASAIAYELLRLDQRVHTDAESSAATQTLSRLLTALPLLQTFTQGAEPLALQLLDDILHTDLSTLPADLRETTRIDLAGHKDGLLILRPLLQHAILADDKHVTAPTRVDSAYLKATTSLRAAAPFDPLAEQKRKVASVLNEDDDDRKPTSNGLPLPPDWLFHPIGELLRSQDSVALQQAPADWSASETELVRATLSLVILSIEISSATTGSTSVTNRSETDVLVKEDDDGFVRDVPQTVVQSSADGEPTELDSSVGPVRGMPRSQIFWGIMRVYMLEHQPMAGPTDGEVFRDDTVAALLGRLMGYLASVPPAEIHPSALATLSSPPSPATSTTTANPSSTPKAGASAPLEIASAPYLSPEPFLTFYQDLVGLFENSSFGDPLFARIILPPLAFGLGYDAEYRKLIWGNPNVLRLIRTTVADAPIEDDSVTAGVWAYWCRVDSEGEVHTEGDLEILAAYGQALVKGRLRSELLEQIAMRGLVGFFFATSADAAMSQRAEQQGATSAKGAESKEEQQGALGKLRKGLMGAVFAGAPAEIVSRLVRRDGGHDSAIDAEASAEEIERRMEVVQQVCGDRAGERVRHIVSPKQ